MSFFGCVADVFDWPGVHLDPPKAPHLDPPILGGERAARGGERGREGGSRRGALGWFRRGVAQNSGEAAQHVEVPRSRLGHVQQQSNQPQHPCPDRAMGMNRMKHVQHLGIEAGKKRGFNSLQLGQLGIFRSAKTLGFAV